MSYADRCLRILHKYEVEREGFERAGAADRVAKADVSCCGSFLALILRLNYSLPTPNPTTQARVQDAQKQCKSADYRSEFVTKAFFLGGVEKFAVGFFFFSSAIRTRTDSHFET